MTRDIIPTLPKYMRRQRMSLDATESEPVIPIVTPTFDSAETTSNVTHETVSYTHLTLPTNSRV